MKEDIIADIWTLVVEHIPEKHRKDVAADFVNTLMDHGINPYLDDAIEYVIDDEEIEYDEEEYGYDEEE